MHRVKQVLWFAGGLLAVAVMATFIAPKVGAAIKGALVEVIIPSRPFSANLFVPQHQTMSQAAGPGSGGTLGITSITITNTDTEDQTVGILSTSTTGPGCTGAIAGQSQPEAVFIAPAKKTVQFQYPTPFVMGWGGCVSAVMNSAPGATVAIDFVGIIN